MVGPGLDVYLRVHLDTVTNITGAVKDTQYLKWSNPSVASHCQAYLSHP